MQHRRPLALLLPILMLAACGEDQSPTAPTPPAGPGGPAHSHTAGHKVVNSLADPGNGTCNATQCTLREAINDPQSTRISFAPGITGPITLARPGAGGGPLVIEKTLTITGPSAGIVIRRRSTDPAFRIFRIDSGVIVKLTHLTLRNGKPDRTGGGIINFGRLALTTCTVASNSATLGGGGIDNHGRLALTNSRVKNNSAPGGGGINNHGNLMLANSLVAGNSASFVGGGIFNQKAGRLALTKSTIADNSAVEGGGIDNRGQFTLASSLVTGNSASDEGGGIHNRGLPFTEVFGQITNSTVARNSAGSGGGIASVRAGRLTITKSTIAGNSANFAGGGIFQVAGFRDARGEVTLRNSTVSGNSAVSDGGGIYNLGEGASGVTGRVTITNSTIARNSAINGGGIHQPFDAVVRLTNSLVAQNSASTGPDVNNGASSTVFARFSLIGDGSGSGVSDGVDGNQVGSASAPIDPKLAPLANYGGPTRTHRLLLGSPAIDAASSADCPATDQRGVPRPQGAGCDIGSFERIVP
jgi:CSLREA domain-containing protein